MRFKIIYNGINKYWNETLILVLILLNFNELMDKIKDPQFVKFTSLWTDYHLNFFNRFRSSNESKASFPETNEKNYLLNTVEGVVSYDILYDESQWV